MPDNKPDSATAEKPAAAPALAFESFDDEEIPSNAKNPNAERMGMYDNAIRGLAPGKSIRTRVPETESARGAALLFSRAATRVFGKEQKIIDCGTYTKDGVTYAYARRKADNGAK